MKKTVHYKQIEVRRTACGIQLTEMKNKITTFKKHYRDIHVTRRIELVTCKRCKNSSYFKLRKG